MFGIYARISAWGHEHTKSDAYSAAVIQVFNEQGAEYNAIRAGLHVRIHMPPLTSTEAHCDLDFIAVCSNSRSVRSSGSSDLLAVDVRFCRHSPVCTRTPSCICLRNGRYVSDAERYLDELLRTVLDLMKFACSHSMVVVMMMINLCRRTGTGKRAATTRTARGSCRLKTATVGYPSPGWSSRSSPPTRPIPA